jgi:hypothetical protein
MERVDREIFFVYLNHPVKNSYEFSPPLQGRGILCAIKDVYKNEWA